MPRDCSAFHLERRISAMYFLQKVHLNWVRIDRSRESAPQKNPLRQTHRRQQPFVLQFFTGKRKTFVQNQQHQGQPKLPLLRQNFFLGDCFFIAAPCTCRPVTYCTLVKWLVNIYMYVIFWQWFYLWTWQAIILNKNYGRIQLKQSYCYQFVHSLSHINWTTKNFLGKLKLCQFTKNIQLIKTSVKCIF